MGIFNNLVQVFLREAELRLEKEIRTLVHKPLPKGKKKRQLIAPLQPTKPSNLISIAPGLDYMPPQKIHKTKMPTIKTAQRKSRKRSTNG